MAIALDPTIKSFLDRFTVGVMIQNNKGIIEYTNAAMCSIFNLKAEEIIGKAGTNDLWTVTDLEGKVISPEKLPMWQSLKEKKPVENLILGVLRPDKKHIYILLSVIPEITTGNNEISQVFIMVQEITKNLETQRQVLKQKEIFEFVAVLSKDFISIEPADLNMKIDELLSRVGNMMKADRVYIFNYNFQKQTCSNSYEWCAHGVESQIQNLKDSPLELAAPFLEKHLKGEVFQIEDVSKLNDNDVMKEVLLAQHIKSLITVPIFNENNCVGFIGLDETSESRTFSAEELTMLELLADIIGSTQNRLQQKEELDISRFNLNERLKELNCINQINKLSTKEFSNNFDFLQEVFPLIPPAFQFTEKTSVKLRYEQTVLHSTHYQETDSSMHFELTFNDDTLLELKVYNPAGTPFLPEEYTLMDNIKFSIEQTVNTRLAQEKTKKNEIRLQNLLNTQTSYVMRTDMQGRHTYWNKKFEEDFGWLYEDELKEASALSSICSYHHPRTYQTVQKCFENPNIPFKVELDKPRRNGGIMTTLWEFICLTNENNIPDEIQGIGFDISDRKKLEEKLTHSEERYRMFFNASPDACLLFNFESVVIDCNNAACDLLEYSQDELIDKKPMLFTPSFQTDGAHSETEASRRMEKVIQQGKDMFEWTLISKSGKILPLYVSAVTTDYKGNAAVMASMKDVSALKQTETELKKFIAITDQASYGVAMSSLDGILTYCNPAFATMHDYQPEELVGKPLFSLHNEEQLKTVIPLVEKIKTEDGFSMEEVGHIKRNGQPFPTLMSAKLIRNEYGDPLLMSATMMDNSRFKEQEEKINELNRSLEQRIKDRTLDLERSNEELRKARIMADEANRYKSEFLSRMSHELRTPLNSIMGFAQLIELSSEDTSLDKNLKHILDNGQHLINLINEILDLARIESGKISVSLEAVMVQNNLEEIIESLQPLADFKKITIHNKTSEIDPAYIWADKQRFRQIIVNLINNAIKYNRQNGQVNVSLERFFEDNNRFIRIKIADTGIGIAPENQNRLFRPFERILADNSLTEGTGLGLVVVKQLVELMKGRIGMSSVPGEGSEFWVELPETQFEETVAAFEKQLIKEKIAVNKIGTLLLIEDNHSNIELIKQIVELKRPNINLLIALNGKTGIEMALSLSPNMILLDLNLPDIHGKDVLLKLRGEEKTKDIPVVIVTADAVTDYNKTEIKDLFNDFLTKPIVIDKILSRIDKYIHS